MQSMQKTPQSSAALLWMKEFMYRFQCVPDWESAE